MTIEFSLIFNAQYTLFFDILYIILCTYFTWLYFSRTYKLILYDKDRFVRLLNNLNNATTQQLFLLLFVKSQTKNTTLRELFSYNNFKKKRNINNIDLRFDTITIAFSYFIFIANSDSRLKTILILSNFNCYKIRYYRLDWECLLQLDVFDILYVRLLFLITNVICIFANNFNNLIKVVVFLKL